MRRQPWTSSLAAEYPVVGLRFEATYLKLSRLRRDFQALSRKLMSISTSTALRARRSCSISATAVHRSRLVLPSARQRSRPRMSRPAGWVTFTFATPPSVVAGTEYALMLTSTTTTGNEYGWGSNAVAGSGRSSASASAGYGSWTADVNQNAFFRTYVNTSDSGPTPPPVMQQFGMPSSGTCDASAPSVLNWGGAGSGGWGNSWAEWMNGGRGGAVCTRTLVYSNAAGHWITS